MFLKKMPDFRRLLCVVLILAMMMSVVACGGSSSAGGASTPGSTASSNSTAPTTQPTTAPTTHATEPSSTKATLPAGTMPTSAPPPEHLNLEYTLEQADVDAFYSLLERCKQLSLAGEDMEAIDQAVLDLEEMYGYLNAQCTIAMILHYCHTHDPALETRYLDCVEICTQANDAYMQMVREIYLSDSPAKDSLFEGWTQADFDSLMSYDERISQLQQRNAEIGVAYRSATNDAEKIELYIEFVGNNNTIAQFYGYDNYYTYSYEKIYGRDYGVTEMEQLRRYAKAYLVDAYEDTLMNFYNSFYVELDYKSQLVIENFLFADYDKLDKDYVSIYLDTLPEDMADALTDMLENNAIFANGADANPGAFTTMIGDRSFCYFGPDYASAPTIIHEGGHYYASLYTDMASTPMDLAETHSQGNEWLFISALRGHMTEAQYGALVDYSFYENISTILMCLMVDEFEQIVYTTDLTGFTAADFDAIMDRVALAYFPMGDVSQMLADMNSYWRLVVVDQPVYYISYAVSAVAAMSLYAVAAEDHDHALELYKNLCQNPTGEDSFLDSVTAAGLYSPFDEEFYKKLQVLVGDYAG